MKNLLGSNSMDENLLRWLWLDKLSIDMIKILALLTEKSELNMLAETAYNIHDVHITPTINTSTMLEKSKVDRLEEMIKKMMLSIK